MSILGVVSARFGPPGTTTADAILTQENISGAVSDSYWSSDLRLWVIFYTTDNTPYMLICATNADGLPTSSMSNWRQSNAVVTYDFSPQTATSQTYDLLTFKGTAVSGTQLTLGLNSGSLYVPTIDGALAVNHPYTGSVSLLGDLVQDHDVTLTSTLKDIDGLTGLSYEWQKRGADAADIEGNWTPIVAASDPSFTPGTDEAGRFLRVKITYTDGLGYQETVISQVSRSAVIANQAPTIDDPTVYFAKGDVKNDVYTFKVRDFGFKDADAGDTLSAISLFDLPTTGKLSLDHRELKISDIGLTISRAQLDAGLLQFTPTPNLPSLSSENLSYLVFDRYLTPSDPYYPGNLNLVELSRPTSSNGKVAGLMSQSIDLNPYNGEYDYQFSDSNDVDSEEWSFTITQLPLHGHLTWNLNGISTEISANQRLKYWDMFFNGFSYTPDLSSGNYVDHLQYKISDGLLESSSAYDLQFNITNPDNPGVDVSGQVKHWKGLAPVPIAGVAIAIESNTTVSTDTTGHFTLAGADLSNGSHVNATVATPFVNKTDAGITLTDVLATLKVYLGRGLPSDYASPFNLVAADFDNNGVVNLSDVLGLLKYYLGRPSTTVPTWAFVNAADVTSDGHIVGANGYLTKSDVHLDPVSLAADPTTPITLIGVVRGDVDGSWALAHPPVL